MLFLRSINVEVLPRRFLVVQRVDLRNKQVPRRRVGRHVGLVDARI